LYAAQLVDAYDKSHDFDAELARGDLGSLRSWLAENVYAQGAALPAESLIERITGHSLDVEPFFRRLERRVSELDD
jgi:carboxypeptidase Taq